MDGLDKLIIRLQRMGYRTQTSRGEITLEFDAHSKMRGSQEQLDKILPTLTKGSKSGVVTKVFSKESKGSHSKKRHKRRGGKEIVTSAL